MKSCGFENFKLQYIVWLGKFVKKRKILKNLLD